MDQSLEKLLTWLRNEFTLLKRDLANYIIRKTGENTDALADVAKTQKRIADALEKQKALPIHVTHELGKMPEIRIPEIRIPEIKIPQIKIPTINVPKPEVSVTVNAPEDNKTFKLLGEISKKLDALKPFDLWDNVGVKTPLPVILVDENSRYYKAQGGGEGGSIAMVSTGPGARPLNNSGFGSGRVVVTTPGTPVQLPDVPCAEVTITAMEQNSGAITVGGANVIGAQSTRIGTPLVDLQSITIKIDNLKKIFLDAVTANDGATYTYLA